MDVSDSTVVIPDSCEVVPENDILCCLQHKHERSCAYEEKKDDAAKRLPKHRLEKNIVQFTHPSPLGSWHGIVMIYIRLYSAEEMNP